MPPKLLNSNIYIYIHNIDFKYINEILVPNDGWDPLFFSLVFIILTMFFIIFHRFFIFMVEHRCIDTVYIDACIYTAGLEVIMQPWWKDMDFKKKQAYCVRIPGGILTLFNPQTHLKNPGRPSVIFQYFEDLFIIFQWCSLFWRCVSLIFHYFEDCFHYFFHGFHDLKKFLIIDYCQLLFIDFSLLFIDFSLFSRRCSLFSWMFHYF